MATIKTCPNCNTAAALSVAVCTACGASFAFVGEDEGAAAEAATPAPTRRTRRSASALEAAEE